MDGMNSYSSNSATWRLTATFNSDKDRQTETFTAADHGGSHDSHLCLGTVKSARTSFLLLALVFMFMQKSIAAYQININIRAFAKNQKPFLPLFFIILTFCNGA